MPESKRPPGRPPLHESRADETIRLRVTSAQADAYRAAAEAGGESFSVWARRHLDRIAAAHAKRRKS